MSRLGFYIQVVQLNLPTYRHRLIYDEEQHQMACFHSVKRTTAKLPVVYNYDILFDNLLPDIPPFLCLPSCVQLPIPCGCGG